MNIKILSNTTINRIAAGEVVERPASAIKELVENAIDAGATKVDILIENAGRNLISISDDGIGMSRDDLILAVERHATSKLSDEDINSIMFFGFRGEALPSIASVSRMNITSKHKDSTEDFAWSLQINAGDKQEPIPASLQKGTKIEVRDLFFATPARLKFLKAEKTEVHYIAEIISKIAMANPAVSFSLISDNKELFSFKAADLYNRIADYAGKNFKENFTSIALDDIDIKVSGYVSVPTFNHGTSNEQYFFINKRPIKDKLLSMAVKIAYQDFVPTGRHPQVYLFLEMDSSFVDVNVHPAKSEVRFKDSSLVRSAVISSIKQAIRNIGNQASDHLSEAIIDSFAPERIIASMPVNEPRAAESPRQYMPARPSFSSNRQIFAPVAPMVTAQPQEFEPEQIDFPLGSACGQIHDTYIISQTNEGMILIDQHAAHERIFYERLKLQMESHHIPTQRLFIPEIVELPEHIIEQLFSRKEEFAKMGLYFEKFGTLAISVTELPAMLKCPNVKELVMDIVDDLNEYQQQVSLEKKINHFLATYACHHSIRAGRSLSIKEMNALLREMESCPHTGQCNHGRPTYIKLSLKDMEKLFERT